MKKFILGLLCVALPLSASAEWVAGVQYFNLSDDDGGADLSFGGVSASIGYKFDMGCNCYIIPSFNYGIGLSDEKMSFGEGMDASLELDNMMGFDVRGQWEFDSGMYVFAAPSYRQLEITAKASIGEFSGSSSAESDWEFGLGAGLGYNFNETIGVEAGYERIDTSDIWSVGMRFNF
ncbi:Outer membrane protein beta-barrel domain-containing protein [Alteromonadaceae bacterium Bs31]|nr:Outer membrane protein beta-barrel domain-containing protein [Alteromonadaceae bacterium Bs31]